MPKKPNLDSIASIAAEYGIDLSTDDLKSRAEIQAQTAKESRSTMSAGTLLLESLHTKHRSMLRTCKYCKRTFMSNFCRDSYCSNEHMVAEFERHFGISWNRLTLPGNPWEQEPPLRVSPDQTEALYEWARELVHQYEQGTLQMTQESPEILAEAEPPDELSTSVLQESFEEPGDDSQASPLRQPDMSNLLDFDVDISF